MKFEKKGRNVEWKWEIRPPRIENRFDFCKSDGEFWHFSNMNDPQIVLFLSLHLHCTSFFQISEFYKNVRIGVIYVENSGCYFLCLPPPPPPLWISFKSVIFEQTFESMMSKNSGCCFPIRLPLPLPIRCKFLSSRWILKWNFKSAIFRKFRLLFSKSTPLVHPPPLQLRYGFLSSRRILKWNFEICDL